MSSLSFTNYLTSKYPGKISGVSGEGVDCKIIVTSSATPDDIIAINNEKSTYNWNTPDLNLDQFSLDCGNDNSLPPQIDQYISRLVQLYPLSQSAAQSRWSSWTANPPSWWTAQVTDSIRSHATINGVDLP